MLCSWRTPMPRTPHRIQIIIPRQKVQQSVRVTHVEADAITRTVNAKLRRGAEKSARRETNL